MAGMRRAATLGAAVLALAIAVPAGRGGQDAPSLGFIARDRVIEMAKVADPAFATFEPSPVAVESFVALVDPVHLRLFFRPSQAADVVLAAKVGRAVDAAASQALTLELVAVADDLSEPKALVAENAVTAAPEIVVYWLNAEAGRMHPEPGSAVDADLADFIFQTRVQIAQEMLLDREFFKFTFHKDLLPLDCKRCHGPAGR